MAVFAYNNVIVQKAYYRARRNGEEEKAQKLLWRLMKSNGIIVLIAILSAPIVMLIIKAVTD